MRVITGCLKRTPLPWLPVLANIIPAETRKKGALVNIVRNHEGTNNSMLSLMAKTTPKGRLKSRKPTWATARKGTIEFRFQRIYGLVQRMGRSKLRNSDLISNPSIPLAGFSLPRQNWVTLNRLKTGVG